MAQRASWRGLASNQWVAAAAAGIILIVAVAGAATRDTDKASTVSGVGPGAQATSTPTVGTGSEVTSTASAVPNATSAATIGGGGGGSVPIPGLGGGQASKPCVKAHSSAPGVTDTSIKIGQIITDNPSIGAQFAPAAEGLKAFVNEFNKGSGICGRKLVLDSRNDQLQPSIHVQDMRALGASSLAYVANESVLDQLDYNSKPPFKPNFMAGGSFVPDVGGLAFSYARSQSPVHGGVIGSVSPTLVGGGQYKFFQHEAITHGGGCKKAGVVYLNEPTGASKEQALVGAASLAQSWGADLGTKNVQTYAANLNESKPDYQTLVARMSADGMNCVFAYTDLQSSINLVSAMKENGVWPPSKCSGAKCYRIAYIPLSAYDPKFIRDAGDASVDVTTFIPHVPLSEPSNPALATYEKALKAIPNARPSTFSILGYTSGVMLIQALEPCAAAPTRDCLLSSLRKMKNFTGGGLLGGTSPFNTTRVTFDPYGTFDWKWIFTTTVAMRVADKGGKRDFYRINPASGFFNDHLEIARGKAA